MEAVGAGAEWRRCPHCGEPLVWLDVLRGVVLPVELKGDPKGCVILEDGLTGLSGVLIHKPEELHPRDKGRLRACHYTRCAALLAER